MAKKPEDDILKLSASYGSKATPKTGTSDPSNPDYTVETTRPAPTSAFYFQNKNRKEDQMWRANNPILSGSGVSTSTGTSRSDFDEQAYLTANKDVANAISKGLIGSGYDHWIKYGQGENRSLGTPVTKEPDGPVAAGVDVETQQTRAEQIATGESGLSEDTKIKQATIVGADGEVPEGTVTEEGEIQQIADDGEVEATSVGEAPSIDPVRGQAVAAQIEKVNAATMRPELIADTPTMEAAQSAVSQLSEAGQTQYDAAIDGATISADEIEEGKALTVEGALSSGAFAEAAKGEASQVDTGGLPALEDIDLMSPTVQAQIADLPEEALVSSQMDSLLQGMEEGKTPAWALPALTAVEEQLAARGMSASSVGRNALFSAIVSAALPIAQSNAQALQQRANMNLGNKQQAAMLEAQLSQQGAITQFQTTAELQALNANLANAMGVANLNAEQQTAIYNATTQAGMDMAKFTTEQQVELANSKWMQTASIANLNNQQQATLQEVTLLAQMDMQNADAVTKVAIENARNFLQMDLANLNAEQQALTINQQSVMQTLLSNQSAANAAAQFNAASQNQVNTFMANLSAQIAQQNAAQQNAMEQFNTQQVNAGIFQEAAVAADFAKLDAQFINSLAQYNDQIDFQRSQWNASNAQAIEQSNVAWRRQANTADTAAENAINQQNAMNSFNLESSALSFLWQQLRDEAAFNQQSYITYQTNATNLYATALSQEKPRDATLSKVDAIVKAMDGWMD